MNRVTDDASLRSALTDAKIPIVEQARAEYARLP
jgi:hypothetical protein